MVFTKSVCSGSRVLAFLLLSWSDASEISVASVASVASDISVTSSSGTWKHRQIKRLIKHSLSISMSALKFLKDNDLFNEGKRMQLF